MSAIYNRELGSFFHSITGWLFVAANIFISGLYFFMMNLNYGYASIAATISGIIFILLILIPILTMRILSEERRQKTDQLILTAPVTIGKIVLGKYLATVTVFAIPTLMLCLYPLILACFGTVAFGESYTAILAYFLFGCTCIAVGVFVSSLTESQVIAAVLSFAALFLGYMMNTIISVVPDSVGVVKKILAAYDLVTPMNEMMTGTLNLSGILFYVTLIAVVLFLTVQVIQKRRYQVSVKTISLGAYSTGMIVIVLVAAVLVNLAATQLPARMTTIDVTGNKLFSLTDTSKEMLKNLDEDVTIYVLQSEEAEDKTLRQTLIRFADGSPHVTVKYRDPVVYPSFYMDYTDGNIAMNSLIVVGEKRYRVVDYTDMYVRSTSSVDGTTTVTGYDGEGQIASAINYCITDKAPKMYILQGHGEDGLSETFRDGAKKLNIAVETIKLMQNDIPEDAESLFILAPQQDLNADETDKVIAYLQRGGKLVVTTAFTADFDATFPNFNRILGEFGISMEEGIIAEQDPARFYQNQLYLLPKVLPDGVTQGLTNNKYLFMAYCKGLLVEQRDDAAVKPLLQTSEKAVAKTNLNNAEVYEAEPGDKQGPFTVGAYAIRSYGAAEARMFVFACQTLFDDSGNTMVAGNNLQLFTQTIATLADTKVSVSVPVKNYELSDIVVDFRTAYLIAGALLIVIPLTLIILGVAIWVKRRRG